MEKVMTNIKLVTGGPDLLPDCSNYDKNAHPKAANTVDTVIARMFESKLQVLLIKRKFHPDAGMWAIPGGFLDIKKNESLDNASTRELEEETKVKDKVVRQLKTYGDPDRDPRDRIITTAYYALVDQIFLDKTTIKASDDASDYMWADAYDLPEMALDHAEILSDFLSELRERVQYTPIAFELLPSKFTWSDIKAAYEAILDNPVSQNFRRDLKTLYTIRETEEKRATGYRPASLLEYLGSNIKF
jgi:8-oxo-dGTP diphosphatase